jgi:hypothetical protein
MNKGFRLARGRGEGESILPWLMRHEKREERRGEGGRVQIMS